jgi:thiol-disulfide isomerase/thioredoxin
MRLKTLLSVIGLILGSAAFAQEGPVLKGCIENVPDSITEVKVAYVRGKGLAVKKSIPLDKGCFETHWDQPELGIFIIYLDQLHSFDFVISSGTVTVEGDYNDLVNISLDGPGMQEFGDFKKLLSQNPKEDEIRSFMLAIKDDALREFILPQILPLNPDTNVYWLRNHFWDYTNLLSPATLINPFFEKNRNLYFDQVLGHDPDTVIKHLQTLLAGPMDEQVRKVLVSTATYHYETSNYMGEDKVFVWLAQQFYNSGFADWMSKEDLAKIKEKSDGLSTELIGNPARDFAFDTRDRGRIKLSEVESPITILYFWDATCGHCKKETPRLKKFYEEYKDKGVEVVAITLENEFTDWDAYIAQHQLTWINGFESNFERPNFLWYYYIPSTPKKLVLDKDKKIIAKNLDVETTLRTFIDDYLAGKVK